MGSPFFAVTSVLFPSFLLMGPFTFKRVLQSGIEGLTYTRGITPCLAPGQELGLVGIIQASKSNSHNTRWAWNAR